MVYLSFMSRAKVWGFTNDFTLQNYLQILEPIYMSTFGTSLKLAVLTTAIVTLIGYPFGYFMARLGAKAKRLMMIGIMIPFWTSSLVRLNGWIIVFRSNGVLDKLLMWIGLTDEPLKLLYSYPAVVFGMVYALCPFMMLSVYSSAEKLDWRLLEAASDLGAGRARAFFDIAFPLTMPGLMSGIVLTFIPSMGLFFVADILGGSKVVLIGNVIQEQMTKGRNLPFAAALSVVLMLMTSCMLGLYRKICGNWKGLD
ncbi:MAG: ABC transporter permease [Lachnospiraceae bacterium]|nr:ABC transporter permease [Lachnospiraceae bacterium]